ncbi:hypothetical protein V1509DRAFT_616992 [Lipomyces kononenkoae]
MPRDSKRARQEATTDEPDDDFVRLLIEEARQNDKRRHIDGVNAFIKRKTNPNGIKPNTNFLNRVVKNADFHNTALLKKETEVAAARLRKLNQTEAPFRSASKSRLREGRKSEPTSDTHQDVDGNSLSAAFSARDPERVSGLDSDGGSLSSRHPRHRDYNKRRGQISVDAERRERKDIEQYDEEHQASNHCEKNLGHSRGEGASKRYSQEALQHPRIETKNRPRTR